MMMAFIGICILRTTHRGIIPIGHGVCHGAAAITDGILAIIIGGIIITIIIPTVDGITMDILQV